MLTRQELIHRFLWGMSILNSYISFNSSLNYHDINIFSENFMRDLLNILYGYQLQNENYTQMNSPGFDLESAHDGIIVQVTSSITPQKIRKTFVILDGFASGLSGYTVKFVVLSHSAAAQKNYQGRDDEGYSVPDSLRFDPRSDILDLSDLSKKVNDLDDGRLLQLAIFMERNANLFIQRVSPPAPKDRVGTVIDEYANNYESPLFQHAYAPDTAVRLCNLYVNPAFRGDSPNAQRSRNIVSLFSQFLWQSDASRMLFIDGDAAIGKTSLISWLCYHYRNIPTEDAVDSIGKAIFLDSKLVCVRLRELDLTGKTNDAVQPILSYLGVNSLADFHEDYPGAVIILDGIDEISMIDNSVSSTYITEFLLNVRKQFKQNKFIITGRPHFFHVSELQTTAFRVQHVNLLHFDHSMREEWIQKYEDCGEVIPEQTKQYILSLNDHAAEGVADTPLALYLLVSCEIREELQGNRWALYHEIFRNAIMKTEYNENFAVGTAHPACQNRDVIYSAVCNIAFQMFQNSKEERYYITSQELDQIIHTMDLRSVPVEWVRRCCVLCAYWKSNSNAGALEFYHNDIRDFFFCEYICEALDGTSLSGAIPVLCKIFQYGYISGTTWEQTFQFLYMRLKYKAQTASAGTPFVLPPGSLFSKQFLSLFTSRELFGFPFADASYPSIRRVFFNAVLLLRLICQIWFEEEPERNRLCFWDSAESHDLLAASNVFQDWHEMFLQSITLPSGHTVSVGSFMDLSNIKFRNISLNGALFDHSLFDHASFAGVQLQRASFKSAILRDADFSGCDLQNADFRCATLINVNFSGTKLTEAVFDDAAIQGCNFAKISFRKSSFVRARFSDCMLSDTKYPQSTLLCTVFQTSQFSGADFREASHLDRTSFFDCQLSSVNFSCVKLSDATFQNCNLTKSCFYDASLRNVTFQEGILSEIDFDQATLSHTDLSVVDSSCNMRYLKHLLN